MSWMPTCSWPAHAQCQSQGQAPARRPRQATEAHRRAELAATQEADAEVLRLEEEYKSLGAARGPPTPEGKPTLHALLPKFALN
eukprot:6644217-Pyramimonas_sp.AAC.1